MTQRCCAPSRDADSPAGGATAAPGDGGDAPPLATVPIPAGDSLLGSNDELAYPDDGEGPVRRITLDAFGIAPHTVTNAEFARFVAGHRLLHRGRAVRLVVRVRRPAPRRLPADARRRQTPSGGARSRAPGWRHPEGPQSNLDGRDDHPVVHVSWNDAAPTASGPARGCPRRPSGSTPRAVGSRAQLFPWGDELEPGGEHRMNVWQGEFPARNTHADGYLGTCPVDTFEPNGYGLYNMTGNVWEWMRRLVRAGLARPRPRYEPARTVARHAPRRARRLVPVPRVVLPPLPRRRAQRADTGLLVRQRRLPLRGAVALLRRRSAPVRPTRRRPAA